MTESGSGAGPRIVVQIPCHNEAATLAAVIAAIPREWELDGERTARVLVLVIDDGSGDGTAAVARAAGADAVLDCGARLGLAGAFRLGLERSLAMGAEVVVNIDGDGQYRGEEIPTLVAPILECAADLVLGARPVATTPHFSFLKRRLQVFGSSLVRLFSGLQVTDATTGFRAFSRDAALRLNIHTDFTYTLETLLQAGEARLRLSEVPVSMAAVARPSRLSRSATDYIMRSLRTAPRMVLLYRPLASFVLLGALVGAPGLLLGLRYLYFILAKQGGGHVQSLILAAILILMGFGLMGLGLLGDVIAGHRRLAEEALYRLRRREAEGEP